MRYDAICRQFVVTFMRYGCRVNAMRKRVIRAMKTRARYALRFHDGVYVRVCASETRQPEMRAESLRDICLFAARAVLRRCEMQFDRDVD